MDQVIAAFRRSIAGTLARLAGGIAIMAVCAMMAFRAIPGIAPGSLAALVGGAGLAVSGLLTVMTFLQLFSSDPVVEVATSGLRDRRRSPALIPWTAIAKVSIQRRRGRRVLALQFHPGTRPRPSGLGRIGGGMNAARGGFSISMAGLDGSFDDLISAIKKANAVAARAS